MVQKWLMIAVLAFCVAAVFAQEEMEVEDKEEPSTNVATSNSRATTGDLSFPVWLVSFLEHGGAVAAGILAVLALGMILVQTFGLRTCLLFNNCNDVANAHAYSSNGYPADYYGTFNNPHTKRSLEYVGPVLKALSNAYVKYNKKVVSQPEKTA